MDTIKHELTFSQAMSLMDALKVFMYGHTILITCPDRHIRERAVRRFLDGIKYVAGLEYVYTNGCVYSGDRQAAFALAGERMPQLKHKPNPYRIERITL